MGILSFLKKSKKVNSAVKEPQPIQSAIQDLPQDWNKDEFHFVNVVAHNGVMYEGAAGYIWATSNWVELHIFDAGGMGDIYETIQCQSDWKVTSGFTFSGHRTAVIIPRNEVKFSYTVNQQDFYSEEHGFKDTVYVEPVQSDVERWEQWHPDNKYYSEFPVLAFKGFFHRECHMGVFFREYWTY